VNSEEVAGTRKPHTLPVEVTCQGDDGRAKVAEERKTRNQGISKIEKSERPKSKDKPYQKRVWNERKEFDTEKEKDRKCV
jgi:hypothetical protein